MVESLKNRTISGMLWSGVQRFGMLIMAFIVNLVFARVLTPDDFGCIGILVVIVEIANTFIDGGFGVALIQRKIPDEKDFSTIFYWNIILSILLFLLFYVLAPLIADYFKMHELKDCLRVYGVILILGACGSIQSNILIKQLKFKKIAIISAVSYFFSAFIGIYMVYQRWGVWSYVVNILMFNLFKSILLWLSSDWRPQFVFCWASIKSLFRFGGLMLLSDIGDTIYKNIQPLVIGKVFSTAKLGFYTQAKKLAEVPAMGFTQVVMQVTFPVLANLQDDFFVLRKAVSKSMRSIVFLNFPLMILLILIARPLFVCLFTEEWLNSVPYFQVLCVGGMLYAIDANNTNVLKAIGRSDVFFNMQLLKYAIGFIGVAVGLYWGLMEMLWAMVIADYLFFFIRAYVLGRMIGYGIKEQMHDVYSCYLLSLFVGGVIYIVNFVFEWQGMMGMVLCIGTYCVSYLSLAYLFRLDGSITCYEILKSRWSLLR